MSNLDASLNFERSAASWPVVARALSDGRWHSLASLRSAVLEATGFQGPAAGDVLNTAYRDGFLEKRWGAKKARYFRVTDEGRRQRPELRVP